MRLILQIAAGYVLGNVALEIMGFAVDGAAKLIGRIVGLFILLRQWQQTVIAHRRDQELAARETAAPVPAPLVPKAEPFD